METKILWHPNYCSIEDVSDEVYKLLTHELSFVCNKSDTPEYDWRKEDNWNGVCYLSKLCGTKLIFPSGLIYRAMKALESTNIKYEVEETWNFDDLPKLSEPLPIPDYRTHQFGVPDKLINTVVASREAAPRTGKTYEAFGTIAELGLKTIYIVSRKEWMSQALQVFKKLAGPDKEHMIGCYGSGIYEPSDVTVVIDAALDRHIREGNIPEFLSDVGCIIFDEADLSAGTTRAHTISMHCSNAPYHFGFSATLTAPRTDGASMLVEAHTGPVVSIYAADEAQAMGYHAPGRALFIRLPRIIASSLGEFYSQYRTYLINNLYRTLATVYMVQWGLKNLGASSIVVLVKRVEQAKTLQSYLPASEIAIGTMGNARREYIMEGIKNGNIRCVITTLYHRAVDIVNLEMCINAGGMKAAAEFIQGKYRAKTKSEDSNKVAYYIDFIDQLSEGMVSDDTIGSIEKHSKERLGLAEKDESWNLAIKNLEDLDGFMSFFTRSFPGGLPLPPDAPMLWTQDSFVRKYAEVAGLQEPYDFSVIFGR